jgi:transposase InsO family protein
LQARIRRRAVVFYQARKRYGCRLGAVAKRLRLKPRTLRHWDHQSRQFSRAVALLGRPKIRSGVRERNQVIDFLKHEGPHVGVPALQTSFPHLARAELADLLTRYRRVVQERYHETIQVCHWTTPGRVWAIDWAEPSELGADRSLPPIDGCYPYLLAVRDVASGYQLAWLPREQGTAETVCTVLTGLFDRYGAPLVLKADNGPQFRANETKAFLSKAGVVPLYSPPYYPEYNGAIEAGIAALKRRTELHAIRAGRLGMWTWDDVEAARREANTGSIHEQFGCTPAEAWVMRNPITAVERMRFAIAVDCHRLVERVDQRIGSDEALDHWCDSAVDRKAIERVLVAHDYLLFSRRRIPLRIKSRKVANIW